MSDQPDNTSTHAEGLWSNFVKQLEPYVPGEQPVNTNLVKLNTNESPYPPSPAVLAAVQSQLGEQLRLYPDPDSMALKRVIAEYFSTDSVAMTSDNIFLGNGSDEVLAHAFNAFFSSSAADIISRFNLQLLSRLLPALWY